MEGNSIGIFECVSYEEMKVHLRQDYTVSFIVQVEYDNTEGQLHLWQLDDCLELRLVVESDLHLASCILHVASRVLQLSYRTYSASRASYL